jgi:putative membrane protein
MQFLKTLFWMVVAVMLALFAKVNWHDVQLVLWGGLLADVKLPVLVFAAFLLGWIPTLIIYRARLWALRRRFEPIERNVALAPRPVAPTTNAPGGPDPERVATDSKVWPAP